MWGCHQDLDILHGKIYVIIDTLDVFATLISYDDTGILCLESQNNPNYRSMRHLSWISMVLMVDPGKFVVL